MTRFDGHNERVDLVGIFQKRGYKLRKHLEEAPWDERKLTVVDLTDEENSIFAHRGIEALQRHLAKKGQWLFPALEIQNHLLLRNDTVLAVGEKAKTIVSVPKGQGFINEAANCFVKEIKKLFSVDLPLQTDDEAVGDLFQTQNIIIFGGSHENLLARELSYRYLCGVADAAVPGEGGWLVITYIGLGTPDKNVIQIAGDRSQLTVAVQRLVKQIQKSDENLLVKHIYHIAPGHQMKHFLFSWEDFLKQSLSRAVHPQLKGIALPSDPASAAEVLAKGLDSGGRKLNYRNILPVSVAVMAARYFFITGDERAITFFRAILFKLADYYLKVPEGASYPSDFDFYAGLLVHYYSLLEHYPIFSPEDRLIIANLLLA